MSDAARSAKIQDVSQALADINRAAAELERREDLELPSLNGWGRSQVEAVRVWRDALRTALHRIGALTIELAQERHDCATELARGFAADIDERRTARGAPDPGRAPRVRSPRGRK